LTRRSIYRIFNIGCNAVDPGAISTMAHAGSVLRAFAALAIVVSLLAAGVLSPALAQPTRNGPLPQPLPLFPPDNWWNVDITNAPVDAANTAFINFVGVTRGMHPDFGGDADDFPEIYGMPFISVPGNQPRVPVTFVEFGHQSDSGAPGVPSGYPIPEEAKNGEHWIEGGYPGTGSGGDRHMLIVDRDNRILYELYHTHWNALDNRWEAGSGAIFRLDANERRPDTWTSADAAGLAILPGLVRYDEVFGPDPIRHAFRVTVRSTNGYVYPASHRAGSTSGALPMGARLRLKAGKDISGFAPALQKIFQAMKTYGLIVADNGSDLYVQGQYDTRWDNGVLNPAFSALKGGDFEVIQLGWRPPVATQVGPFAFYTLPPCRLLDTRNPSSPTGGPALPYGFQRVVAAAGRCGIPATARALSVNLTVAAPSQPGFLSLFPGDSELPVTSALNFKAGRTLANNAIVRLSPGRAFTVAASPAGGSIHVLVDVNGYFQ
jgi:hypothetical protein